MLPAFVPDSLEVHALARASWAVAYGTLECLVQKGKISSDDAGTMLSKYHDYFEDPTHRNENAAGYLKAAMKQIASLTPDDT